MLERVLAQVLAQVLAMVEKELEVTEEGFHEERWQVQLVGQRKTSSVVSRTTIGIQYW